MNLQRKYYRQSIIVFGLVIPAVLCGLLIIAGSIFASGIEESYQSKVNEQLAFDKKNKQALALQAEIGSQNDDVVHWEQLVSQETASTVSFNLREIEKKLPSKEFQTTSQQFPNSRAGFASGTAQKASQVQLGFRGTYRSMQKALVELESHMPQLQLHSFSIDEGRQSGSLNFTLNYSAWEQ